MGAVVRMRNRGSLSEWACCFILTIKTHSLSLSLSLSLWLFPVQLRGQSAVCPLTRANTHWSDLLRPAACGTRGPPHSEHRFPAPASKVKEGCRKPVLGVWGPACLRTRSGSAQLGCMPSLFICVWSVARRGNPAALPLFQVPSGVSGGLYPPVQSPARSCYMEYSRVMSDTLDLRHLHEVPGSEVRPA